VKTWWIHRLAGPLRLHLKKPCRWMPKGRAQFYLRHAHRVYLLTSLTHRGICVVAMWDMCLAMGHLHPPTWRWEYPSMKKRSVRVGTEGVKHLAALESDIWKGLLPLVEHCAVRQYDDGEPREPGWITLKTQGAAWVCQVKDPDGACSFSAVAETLDKALETAALLLSCDEAPWEPDRFLAQQKAQKRK
jgi:hypothetical protein